MKITEKRIKKILAEETELFLEQIGLLKKLKNVRGLTLDAFIQVINVLSQDINIPPEEAIQMYLELALDLKRNWGIKQYEAWPEEEKEIFLKTTYPQTPRDESERLLVSSFLNPALAKLIFSDVRLAIKKTEDAKEKIEAGEYLGPDAPGAEPKSPYWKEFLEEAIEEEINELIKNDA
jgi:hypothetical protein